MSPGVEGRRGKQPPYGGLGWEPADPSQVPSACSLPSVLLGPMPQARDVPPHVSVCHLEEWFQLHQSPTPKECGVAEPLKMHRVCLRSFACVAEDWRNVPPGLEVGAGHTRCPSGDVPPGLEVGGGHTRCPSGDGTCLLLARGTDGFVRSFPVPLSRLLPYPVPPHQGHS